MMRNENVAVAWANRRAAESGNFYTDGTTLWSYGHHFPVAHHHPVMGALITTRTYSVTTARHVHYAWNAVHSAMAVDNVLATSGREHRRNVAHLLVEARKAARKAYRATTPDNAHFHLRSALLCVSTAEKYREQEGASRPGGRVAAAWATHVRHRVGLIQAEKDSRRWLRTNHPAVHRKYKRLSDVWAARPELYDAYLACCAMGGDN